VADLHQEHQVDIHVRSLVAALLLLCELMVCQLVLVYNLRNLDQVDLALGFCLVVGAAQEAG